MAQLPTIHVGYADEFPVQFIQDGVGIDLSAYTGNTKAAGSITMEIFDTPGTVLVEFNNGSDEDTAVFDGSDLANGNLSFVPVPTTFDADAITLLVGAATVVSARHLVRFSLIDATYVSPGRVISTHIEVIFSR